MGQDQTWPAQQGRVSCSPGLGSALQHVLLCPQPCCCRRCKGPNWWSMIPHLFGCWCQAPSGWKEDKPSSSLGLHFLWFKGISYFSQFTWLIHSVILLLSPLSLPGPTVDS